MFINILIFPCKDSKVLKNRDGYHDLGVNSKYRFQHRKIYCLKNNHELLQGECVLHKCDNPWCIEETHLFLGTRADNVYDMVSKNRHIKGSKSGMSNLNEEKVKIIRNLHASGRYSTKELAISFNVGKTCINKIVLKQSWKHVN